MYQKLEECPICKHQSFSNSLICEDYSQSHESFVIVRCNNCDLHFTNPRPDEQNIAKYYDHKDYISHTNKANNFINAIYKIARYYTLRQKEGIIKTYTKQKKLLDFGCGTGIFLHHMSNSSFNVEGYEPSEQARLLSSQSGKFQIHNKLDQIQKNKYDIITAWHVLEHVHSLKKTLKVLRNSLTRSGIIIAAVPNFKSLDAQIYKHQWAAYDVPRHLYHFNQTAFSALAASCKLNIKQVHPMMLDSYYVSMLSESHKGTSSSIHRLVNGFVNGRKSNISASQTGEYSSLIYVLSK